MWDFYQWGYLKSNVYQGHPRKIEEVIAAVQNQIDKVSKDILRTADAHFTRLSS